MKQCSGAPPFQVLKHSARAIRKALVCTANTDTPHPLSQKPFQPLPKKPHWGSEWGALPSTEGRGWSAAQPAPLSSSDKCPSEQLLLRSIGSFSSAVRLLRKQVTHLRQNLLCLLNVNQKSPLLPQPGLPGDGTPASVADT